MKILISLLMRFYSFLFSLLSPVRIAVSSVVAALVMRSSMVFAVWTPLISAEDFTGIQDDMLTTAAGMVALILIVVGLGFLIRSFVK